MFDLPRVISVAVVAGLLCRQVAYAQSAHATAREVAAEREYRREVLNF